MKDSTLIYSNKWIRVSWLKHYGKSGLVIETPSELRLIIRWKEVPFTKRGIMFLIPHSKKFTEEWERTKAWKN